MENDEESCREGKINKDIGLNEKGLNEKTKPVK